MIKLDLNTLQTTALNSGHHLIDENGVCVKMLFAQAMVLPPPKNKNDKGMDNMTKLTSTRESHPEISEILDNCEVYLKAGLEREKVREGLISVLKTREFDGCSGVVEFV